MAETYFKNEVEKYQYFQLPKWLFKEPYKQLSNNAKIMYALLYNRLNLNGMTEMGKYLSTLRLVNFAWNWAARKRQSRKLKKSLLLLVF